MRHFLYVPNVAEGSRWLILISGIAMVTEEQIAAFRETFEGLAHKAGGEHDDWEAAATP